MTTLDHLAYAIDRIRRLIQSQRFKPIPPFEGLDGEVLLLDLETVVEAAEHGRPLFDTKRPLRVYIASSWRNPHYDRLRMVIRGAGHTVLDWREGEHPLKSWGIADERFEQAAADQTWTASLAQAALRHPNVQAVHERDMALLHAANALLLLTPCGRSAHFEAGWAEGRGMPRAIYFVDGVEPEAMTARCEPLTTEAELTAWLARSQPQPTSHAEVMLRRVLQRLDQRITLLAGMPDKAEMVGLLRVLRSELEQL